MIDLDEGREGSSVRKIHSTAHIKQRTGIALTLIVKSPTSKASRTWTATTRTSESGTIGSYAPATS